MKKNVNEKKKRHARLKNSANEKKIQKANIETAAAGISAAESDLKKAEESYKSEMSGIALKVTSMENRITADVEKENPLPKEPVKPMF